MIVSELMLLSIDVPVQPEMHKEYLPTLIYNYTSYTDDVGHHQSEALDAYSIHNYMQFHFGYSQKVLPKLRMGHQV
jgi:hypothetical protein